MSLTKIRRTHRLRRLAESARRTESARLAALVASYQVTRLAQWSGKAAA